jgi:hypothetical protein
MEQFDKEASRTRDYCAGKNAALRVARPDPSLRKERLFRMTNSREIAFDNFRRGVENNGDDQDSGRMA